MTTQVAQEKRGLRQKLGDFIGGRTPRMRDVFTRMKQDAGFIPIFNVDDLETRRMEIKKVLDTVKMDIFDPDKAHQVTKKVIQDTFSLFFGEGSMWYRGLDNRELTEKVSFYLANCMEVGYLQSFHADLFEEAVQLLHLSFQAIDVTNTPPYIIEARSVERGRGVGLGEAEAL